MDRYVCMTCGADFSTRIAHDAHHTLAHSMGKKGGRVDVVDDLKDNVSDLGHNIKQEGEDLIHEVSKKTN